MHTANNDNKSNQTKIQQLHKEKGKFSKMEIGKIEADTSEAHTCVNPEVDKTPKCDIILERTSTHKYNTISSTKGVNHVTTFKNASKMFQEDATEKIKTHIGTD